MRKNRSQLIALLFRRFSCERLYQTSPDFLSFRKDAPAGSHQAFALMQKFFEAIPHAPGIDTQIKPVINFVARQQIDKALVLEESLS